MDEVVEVKCKYCGGLNIEFRKSWRYKSGRSKVEVETELWYCNDCRKTFRIDRRVS